MPPITIKLQVSDDGSLSVLDQAGSKLEGLGQSGAVAGQGLLGLGASLTDLKSGFDIIGNALGQSAGMIDAVNKLGVESLRTKSALDAMSGGQASSWADSMTRATKGIVDNTDLMKSATLALSTGAVSTQKEMDELARAGATLGITFSGSATAGINDLTRALDMVGNKRGLRSLGIDAEEVMTKFNSLKATMGDESAWKLAVMDVAAAQAGKLSGALTGTGTALERLKVQFNDFSESAAENVATGVEATINLITALADVAGKKIDELKGKFDAVGGQLASYQKSDMAANKAIGDTPANAPEQATIKAQRAQQDRATQVAMAENGGGDLPGVINNEGPVRLPVGWRYGQALPTEEPPPGMSADEIAQRTAGERANEQGMWAQLAAQKRQKEAGFQDDAAVKSAQQQKLLAITGAYGGNYGYGAAPSADGFTTGQYKTSGPSAPEDNRLADPWGALRMQRQQLTSAAGGGMSGVPDVDQTQENAVLKLKTAWNSVTDAVKPYSLELQRMGANLQTQVEAAKNYQSIAQAFGTGSGGIGGELSGGLEQAAAQRRKSVGGGRAGAAFDADTKAAMDDYKVATGQATRESIAFNDEVAKINSKVAAGTMSVRDAANAMLAMATAAKQGKTSLEEMNQIAAKFDPEKMKALVQGGKAENQFSQYGKRNALEDGTSGGSTGATADTRANTTATAQMTELQQKSEAAQSSLNKLPGTMITAAAGMIGPALIAAGSMRPMQNEADRAAEKIRIITGLLSGMAGTLTINIGFAAGGGGSGGGGRAPGRGAME